MPTPRRSAPATAAPTAAAGPAIEARRSPIHGNGVFAVRAIPAGEPLIRYVGKLRSHAEADALHEGNTDSGHTFLFTLNEDWVIDANVQGNDARWINHGCAPNCQAVLVEHASDRRRDQVWIEALRDIAPGEELTYNYGIVLAEPHTARMKTLWTCLCGAPTCTGTMLQPKPRKR
jgi:SET domain-containing protein